MAEITATIELVRTVLTPLRAVKQAIDNIVKIDESQHFLQDRVHGIFGVLERIQLVQGFGTASGLDGHLKSMDKTIRGVLEKLVHALDLLVRTDSTPHYKKWIHSKNIRAQFEDVHHDLNTVVSDLTLAITACCLAANSQGCKDIQDQLKRIDRLGEEDKLTRFVEEMHRLGHTEAYCRYNRSMMEFLASQLHPIDQLLTWPPSRPGHMSSDEWRRCQNTLRGTVQLGQKLIERHRTQFDLKTFYCVEDARRGIEMILQKIGDLLFMCGLQQVQICDTVPPECIEADINDLHRKLDFILYGRAICDFDLDFREEWESVKREHMTRIRSLLIIRETDIDWGKEVSQEVREAVYFNTKVMVKRLIPKGGQLDLEDFAKFFTEVAIMDSIRLPYVARFFGASMTGLLVMERSDMDLMEWYRQTLSLTWPQKINALKQAALGLEYVHAQGVIHRGVNSHSFLVFDNAESSVKIADFSSAIEITDVRTISVRRHIGPSLWIAPEIFDGRSHSLASDVFSFGVVMHEVAAQRYPYGIGSTEADIWEKKKNGVPPCDVPADCPGGLVELMRACCSSDAEHRPCMRRVREFLCGLDGTS
ncbi:unnamed protein product [Ostreobium quekettii]|uniref:Protein kinase domain-containing protein n=1 Tax=Ostreobium quekettii TaxID=121088 RepID=A0A8S1JA25_9CHLO|nr:unnamed protein product [Ostreobium quekettii]